MIDVNTLKKRVKVFFELQTPVHIVLKNENYFNGYITEISADFFMFLDRVDGIVPIFYEEVTVFDFFVGDVSSLKKVEK